MSFPAIFVKLLMVAAMASGGVYLYKVDSAATEKLAEAKRINLESQGRAREIQASVETLIAERQDAETLKAQRLQQIAERENRLSEQSKIALESQIRQTELIRAEQQKMETDRQQLNLSIRQTDAAQRRAEEQLKRLAAEQRQKEEKQLRDDQYRTAQALRHAAAEQERAQRAAQRAAVQHAAQHAAQQKVRAVPATVLWQKPLSAVVVRHVVHHSVTGNNTSAKSSRPCKSQAAVGVTGSLPGQCR